MDEENTYEMVQSVNSANVVHNRTTASLEKKLNGSIDSRTQSSCNNVTVFLAVALCGCIVLLLCGVAIAAYAMTELRVLQGQGSALMEQGNGVANIEQQTELLLQEPSLQQLFRDMNVTSSQVQLLIENMTGLSEAIASIISNGTRGPPGLPQHETNCGHSKNNNILI